MIAGTKPTWLHQIAIAMIVALAVLPAACTSGTPVVHDTGSAVMPDPMLTPGGVLTTNANEICVSGYAKRTRDVTSRTKDDVYYEYHIATHGAGEYEIDHLIPLGIGGSNDITNLWPQPTEPRPGRLEKDTLEDVLHRRICDHSLDVRTVQHEIATDWAAAYRKYVLHP
jgi:hypothetical protein